MSQDKNNKRKEMPQAQKAVFSGKEEQGQMLIGNPFAFGNEGKILTLPKSGRKFLILDSDPMGVVAREVA